jgi:ABC-2 type transport system ATP-binding protein
MESVFRRCIGEEVAQGRTVLLSSHILAEVEALCARVSIIRLGRTVETGTLSDLRHLTRTTVIAEVLEAPEALRSLDDVFALRIDGRRVECEVESSGMDDLLRALSDLGVQALTARPATLEELFLRHYQHQSPPQGHG